MPQARWNNTVEAYGIVAYYFLIFRRSWPNKNLCSQGTLEHRISSDPRHFHNHLINHSRSKLGCSI